MSRPIDIVRSVCPKAKASYLTAIEQGDGLFQAHGITTPLRLAHFLAQICHESGGLSIEWESGAYSAQRLKEIFGWNDAKQRWNHSAHLTDAECQTLARNGPAIFERVYGLGNPSKARELGNTQPGDGYRYRGGGLMQTTGKYNYERIGKKIGVDLVAHPELVLSAQHALKPALVEWTEDHLNTFADADDVLAISRAINLGNTKSTKTPNGLSDRIDWLRRIKLKTKTVELRPLPVTAPVLPPPTVPPAPSPPSPKTGMWAGLIRMLVALFSRKKETNS